MDIKDLGTFICGIGATEDLDSAGERIEIKGIDISSLTRDGVFNFEHKHDDPSQTVGKILEAKKIFKKDDCENACHEKFWFLAGEKPYLFIAGVLFDRFGHVGANDVASMLRFDEAVDHSKLLNNINFSIEGTRLGKKGTTITSCLARRITITIHACNKRCIARVMDDPSRFESFIKPESLFDLFKKYEIEDSNLNKDESNVKPIRPNIPAAPKKPTVLHSTVYRQNRPATGHKLYNDPKTFEGRSAPKQTWKLRGEEKKKQLESKAAAPAKKPTPNLNVSAISKKYKDKSNLRKAITAGCGMGAPSSVVNNLQKERNQKDMENVTKNMINDCFQRFSKKEELVTFLKEQLPGHAEEAILDLAKSVTYFDEKRKEEKLKKLIDN